MKKKKTPNESSPVSSKPNNLQRKQLADVQKEIGRMIRDARKAEGLTQKDLAARSNILQSNLSRLENGKSVPSLRTFYRLATALNKEVEVSLVDPQDFKRKK
jgi:HTH-type transcriptional regulator/antitoxin HipB